MCISRGRASNQVRSHIMGLNTAHTWVLWAKSYSFSFQFFRMVDMKTGIKLTIKYFFDLETKLDVWINGVWIFRSHKRRILHWKKVKWRKQYKFKWEDIRILKGVTNYFAVLVWRKWIYHEIWNSECYAIWRKTQIQMGT